MYLKTPCAARIHCQMANTNHSLRRRAPGQCADEDYRVCVCSTQFDRRPSVANGNESVLVGAAAVKNARAIVDRRLKLGTLLQYI